LVAFDRGLHRHAVEARDLGTFAACDRRFGYPTEVFDACRDHLAEVTRAQLVRGDDDRAGIRVLGCGLGPIDRTAVDDELERGLRPGHHRLGRATLLRDAIDPRLAELHRGHVEVRRITRETVAVTVERRELPWRLALAARDHKCH